MQADGRAHESAQLGLSSPGDYPFDVVAIDLVAVGEGEPGDGVSGGVLDFAPDASAGGGGVVDEELGPGGRPDRQPASPPVKALEVCAFIIFGGIEMPFSLAGSPKTAAASAARRWISGQHAPDDGMSSATPMNGSLVTAAGGSLRRTGGRRGEVRWAQIRFAAAGHFLPSKYRHITPSS